MELVTSKKVIAEEAYAKAVDKPAFEALLKRAGVTMKAVQGPDA